MANRALLANAAVVDPLALLRADPVLLRAGLKVTVRQRCGAVEVRVAGPAASLHLSFDRALDPALVRQVVRRETEHYRAALAPRPGARQKE
jgi:hypothetical protein